MVKPFKVIQRFIDEQDRIADFVQNGPSDGVGGYIRDQYRKRCDQFANLPDWARALGNGSTGTMNRICEPYWGDQGVDGPVFEPPFSGGQCDCSVYRVVFQVTNTPDNGGPDQVSGTLDRRARGPITAPVPSGTSGMCYGHRGDRNFSSGTVPPCGGPDTTCLFTASPGSVRASIFTVTLISGPDDCGDPPPVLTPGPNPPADPGPTDGPEPTDDPDGGPIPEIPIPPYDDPIFGPTPIEPGDDPTGGGGEPGPPAGGDGLPGEPDSVGEPAGGTGTDGEGEDVDFGEPPPGKVWVGALIENTVDPRYGNIPGTGPANTVFPYVIGNASLRYSTGRSSSSRMRSRWHDIYRPVTALEVIGCFVQCRPGVSAVVRPVSATICPENPCEDTEDG